MSVPAPNDFFKERRSFIQIKQEIFGKYVEVWCSSCAGKLRGEAPREIVFADLLAADTDPDLVIETFKTISKGILKRPLLNERTRSYLYTKHIAEQEILTESLEALPYFQEFLNPPVVVATSEIRAQLSESLASANQSLAFIDPFQNRFTQQFLQQAVTDWGTDLFMVLHPENISKAVAGKRVSQPLAVLFGDALPKITTYCKKEKDKGRQQKFILDSFIGVLNAKGNHTLLFKINPPETEQPDLYLLFTSPDSQAYRNFKELLLPYSTIQEDGIPAFSANTFPQSQLTLFEQLPEYTLAKLVARITEKAGLYKYKSIETIYELDSAGTNYSKENYVTAVELLRKSGTIELMNAKTMQIIRQPVLSAIVRYKV